MSVAGKVVDWINPVVLRESRQLVRGRFAVGVLMMFMLIMVISSALYVVNIGGHQSRNMFSHGQNLFQILYYVMAYICILFIPAYTALPLLLQKQSTNMDLLMVSTIPPRSVILGKMASAFWMMVLMFSVSMPFMTLTVLLRGIGLFEVIQYMLVMGGVILLATMGFVLIACLPASRVFLSLLSIGYFLFLLMFPSVTTLFHRSGINGDAVLIILGIAVVLLPIGGALATALISPSVANRSLGVRITITVCWIIAGVVCAFVKNNAIQVWSVLSVIGASIAFVAASSEPADMSRRVRRSVPRNRALRWLVFPWFTGPLNGWLWAMGIALTGILLWDENDRGELGSLALYALMYSLFAVLIRRLPLFRRVPEKFTWAIAIALGLLGTLLPIIAHFIVHPNKNPDLLWKLGNPFAALSGKVEGHIAFTIIMIALLATVNIPWMFRQIVNFRPPKIAEPMTAPVPEEA